MVTLRATLLAAGMTAIAVGLLHFFMPGQYRNSNGLAGLSSPEDDFVVLITFAVGVLLIASGAVTLLFAHRPERNPDLTYCYLLISVMLWAGRLGLELSYPVRLRMFGYDQLWPRSISSEFSSIAPSGAS